MLNLNDLYLFVQAVDHQGFSNASRQLGITCLPLSLCNKELAAQELVQVLPEWNAGIVTTALLMPHRRGQLPSVRAVADFLVERFNNNTAST